jgi:hypothetical protein
MSWRTQMDRGPWLDRLFPVELPGGRVASVTELSVLPSNFGILEGGLTPESNARQREKALAAAAKRHGTPVVAVEPTTVAVPELSTGHRARERLPWAVCMARLTSAPLAPERVASEVTIFWWQDALDEPLPVSIARAASSFVWERIARDVDLS